MPKINSLKGIVLNRTIGVEVEGYTQSFSSIRDNGVRHSILKRDGSLSGYNGIEVVTRPLTELDKLDEVFEDITKFGWNCGRGTAGTHIHVDAEDFNLEDKLKMAIFMNLIENAMFLLVKKYRWSRRSYTRNQYCRPIENGWKDVLNRLNKNYSDVNWKGYRNIGNLQYELSNMRRGYFNTPNQTRYQFVNIWSSSHRTIEFRIFHAIRSAKDGKKFAMLSHNLVELVKNSTLEQLEYIADVIVNRSTSAEDMVKKLTESVGLEHLTFKIENKDLQYCIDREKNVRSASTTFVAI